MRSKVASLSGATVLLLGLSFSNGCDFTKGVGEGWDLAKASAACRDDSTVKTAPQCDACCKKSNARFKGTLADERGNGCRCD